MEWVRLAYSRQQVNVAAKVLSNPESSLDDIRKALPTVNNWRDAHAFPLRTFRSYLNTQAKTVDGTSDVVHRMKRLPAILLKLELQSTMQLTQMQDIGGCRAIVRNAPVVRRLVRAYRRSRIKHELVREYDYMNEPKETGYRGVHLVYRYHSNNNEDYNGLKIELQLRTRLQHVWATAVETVGLFNRQQFKSGIGDERWLKFFSLVGSAFALRERLPTVPGTPSNPQELKEEIREYVAELRVIERLNAYRIMLRHSGFRSLRGVRYILLKLNLEDRRLEIRGYSPHAAKAAAEDYFALEQQLSLFRGADQGTDAVLVSVNSINDLKKSFPNYYVDTHRFVRELQRALDSDQLYKR